MRDEIGREFLKQKQERYGARFDPGILDEQTRAKLQRLIDANDLVRRGIDKRAQVAPRPDPNLPRLFPSLPTVVGPASPGAGGVVPVGLGGVQGANAPPPGDAGSLYRQADYISGDAELGAAYKKYLLAYLDSEQKKFTDHRGVIVSANRMGLCVFLVVHVFLAVALFVAVSELRHANKTRKEHTDSTEMELSFQKIALKTSMHGTVLLVLAIVMYFLFLGIVYPVTMVG